MKKTVLFLTACIASVAIAQTSSKLYEEFLKRDKMKLTQEEGLVIQFLKNKDTVNYDVRNIVELDLLNPPTTFVFRDRNGDICFGDMEAEILRCKNEIGLTGVSFQGDAD
ncbi:hypothetical protein K2X05_02755 [bacterium]|nr:hypothetical protein [bacterium]